MNPNRLRTMRRRLSANLVHGLDDAGVPRWTATTYLAPGLEGVGRTRRLALEQLDRKMACDKVVGS